MPLGLVVATVAAGVATVMLRPRGATIDPTSVEQTAYFSQAQIQRAHDFQVGQRVLGFANLGISGGMLALLALRPPSPVRAALAAAGRRPVAVGGAATGAGLSLALAVVTLPVAVAAHERAVGVGLSTQGLPDWLADVGKSALLGALLSAGAAAIALTLVGRFPRHWWAPSAACVAVASAAFVYLSPVLIEPLFNRFTPLAEGELRSEVIDLADRAGVDVGEVYRVDASRRTTGANAYVGGLGSTKRVVLYDNLLEDFPPRQVRLVVAHELAHVKHRDLWRGLAWLALVAPGGMLLVQRLTEALDRRDPRRSAAAATEVLPRLALALAVVSFAGGIAANVTSRRVEAAADALALELTQDPAAAIGLERRLAIRNIAEPQPAAVPHTLFGTHPTTMERIGAALGWARGAKRRETQGGS